jgi:hypothetical protein
MGDLCSAMGAERFSEGQSLPHGAHVVNPENVGAVLGAPQTSGNGPAQALFGADVVHRADERLTAGSDHDGDTQVRKLR